MKYAMHHCILPHAVRSPLNNYKMTSRSQLWVDYGRWRSSGHVGQQSLPCSQCFRIASLTSLRIKQSDSELIGNVRRFRSVTYFVGICDDTTTVSTTAPHRHSCTNCGRAARTTELMTHQIFFLRFNSLQQSVCTMHHVRVGSISPVGSFKNALQYFIFCNFIIFALCIELLQFCVIIFLMAHNHSLEKFDELPSPSGCFCISKIPSTNYSHSFYLSICVRIPLKHATLIHFEWTGILLTTATMTSYSLLFVCVSMWSAVHVPHEFHFELCVSRTKWNTNCTQAVHTHSTFDNSWTLGQSTPLEKQG